MPKIQMDLVIFHILASLVIIIVGRFTLNPMTRYQRRQPDDIFSEILCKFIINLPKKQLKQDRIWFHYQNAYYYYLDHEKNKHSKTSKQQQIAEKDEQLLFFQKLSKLVPPSFKVDPKSISQSINKYFGQIPVYGAILLNQKKTKVLCIYSTAKKLGFPKGKLDEGETPISCAIREVWEEIGYDIGDKINQKQFIKVEQDSKQIIFFVVKNIKQETVVFKTQANYEVLDIIWVPLDQQGLNLNRVSKNAFRKIPGFLQKQSKSVKSLFEIFIENFKVELTKNVQAPKENPFTNFKFDKQKLLSIFK